MRVKTGTSRKRAHKKVLKQAKGYRMAHHRLFKSAQEAVLHAGEYAFMGRKLRKRDLRGLWIIRINAALKELGISYSSFINKLKRAEVEVDRKILAEIAVTDPKTFKTIVEKVKSLK